MLSTIRLFLFVFALLTALGGVMGFAKAKSKPSLIAGGISGGLLLAAGWLVGTENQRAGLVLGALVSLALLGRFAPAYLKGRKLMPGGVMAGLSLVGLVMTLIGLLQG